MKKLITMLMALMMVLALAACGSNDTPAANNGGNDGDNAAPTYVNALEKIKGEGELHVALSPDFSPMEFVDSSKTGQEQYVGFDVSLAKFIAEELGVSLVIEPMSFDASQTAVYTASRFPCPSRLQLDRDQSRKLRDLRLLTRPAITETEQVLLIKAEDAAKYTKVEDFAGQDDRRAECLPADAAFDRADPGCQPHHHR